MQLCQNEYNMLLFGVYQNKTLMPLVPRVSATVLDMMDSRPLSRLLSVLMTLVHTVQSPVNDWYQKLLWSTTVILPSEFLKSKKKFSKFFRFLKFSEPFLRLKLRCEQKKTDKLTGQKKVPIYLKNILTPFIWSGRGTYPRGTGWLFGSTWCFEPIKSEMHLIKYFWYEVLMES